MRISLSSLSALRPPAGLVTAWSSRSGQVLQGLIGLAALILCWQLAGLLAQIVGWQSASPVMVRAATPLGDTGNGRAALTRWFVSTETAKPTSPVDGLQLIAVISGKHGVALISGASPKPSAYEIGKEIRPGLSLAEVRPDRVVLDQAGSQVELQFPTNPNPPPSVISQGVPPPPVTPVSQPAAAPLTPTQVIDDSVSRGQLMSTAQRGNLADWDKGLATFNEGGIRITSADKQPLAQALNLHDGDIIKRVNDRDLTQIADVSLIYNNFSQSQEVNLIILRDGKPQQIHYEIEP